MSDVTVLQIRGEPIATPVCQKVTVAIIVFFNTLLYIVYFILGLKLILWGKITHFFSYLNYTIIIIL